MVEALQGSPQKQAPTTAVAPIHMVHFTIHQMRLMQLNRNIGLPIHHEDLGYLIHCAADQLFGEDLAPKPFHVEPHKNEAYLSVWGYCQKPAAVLHRAAQLNARPDLYDGIDWESFASKPMPTEWGKGDRLGFEVTYCPTTYTHSSGDGKKLRFEHDAFIAACREAGQGIYINREQVYLDWLKKGMERQGAQMLSGVLKAYRQIQVVRRNHVEGDRKASVFARPHVTARGVLEVRDEALFPTLLSRGVGQHRDFGFGMVRLRAI